MIDYIFLWIDLISPLASELINVASILPKINAPVWVIHGESDSIVPIKQVRTFHELCEREKRINWRFSYHKKGHCLAYEDPSHLGAMVDYLERNV